MMDEPSSIELGATTATPVAREGWNQLDARGFGTTAVCDSSFEWMDNQQNKSPCLAAANLMGPCQGTDYTVHALIPTGDPARPPQYSSPTPSTANPCMCSWAVYNLLAACTACQQFQSGIPSWFSWSQNCGSYRSISTFYPTQFRAADNTTLPYWASVDPNTWQDSRWNIAQAKAIADQFQPDLVVDGRFTQGGNATPSPSATARHSSIGAIVGGLVGGIIAVALAAGITIFFLCRNRRKARRQKKLLSARDMSHPYNNNGIFGHSQTNVTSDLLGTYSTIPPVSTPSSGFGSNTTTTFRTHNSETNTAGYLRSVAGSPLAPDSQTASSAPQPMLPINRVEMITPFTLQRNQSTSPGTPTDQDRKGTMMTATTTTTTTPTNNGGPSVTPGRAPMNPPAYSQYPDHPGDFSSEPSEHRSINSTIITSPRGRTNGRHSPDTSITSASNTSGGYWTTGHGSSTSSSMAELLSQRGSGVMTRPGTTIGAITESEPASLAAEASRIPEKQKAKTKGGKRKNKSKSRTRKDSTNSEKKS